MAIVYLLISLGVVVGFAIGAVFRRAVANGQFDDLAGPARRAVTDDGAPLRPSGRQGG